MSHKDQRDILWIVYFDVCSVTQIFDNRCSSTTSALGGMSIFDISFVVENGINLVQLLLFSNKKEIYERKEDSFIMFWSM